MKRVLSVSIEPKSARPLVVWDPVKARAGIGFSVPSPAEATMVRRNPAEVADWLRARGKAARPNVTRARASALGEIFSLVDESETGALDASQVREALTVLGDAFATVEDATRAMARVGIAPDGKMEFPEFLAIVTGPEPVTPRLAAGARRSTRTSLPPELTAVAHRRARLIDRVVTNEGGARVRILERAEESARVDPLAAKTAERRLRREVAANATRAKYMDYGDGANKHALVNEPHATRVMRQKMARERRRRSMAYADGLGTAAMDARVYPTRPPTTADGDEEEDEFNARTGASRDPSEVAPPLSEPDARARRARERLARRLGVGVVDARVDAYESEWRFPEYDRTHRVARAARQRMALELANGARTFGTTCDLLGGDDDDDDDEEEEEEAGVPPAAATMTTRIAADGSDDADDDREVPFEEVPFDVPPHAGYRVRGGVRRVDVTLVSDAISGAGRAARDAAQSRVFAMERVRAERAAKIKAWGEAWKAPPKPLKPPKPPGWEEVKATKIAALDARYGSDARVASEAARSVREREVRARETAAAGDGVVIGDGEIADGIEDALGTSAGGPLDVLGDSTGTAAQPGGGAVLCRLGLPDPNFVRLVDST